MRKLRGFIPTTALAVVLAFGSTGANAGIIITERAEEACTEESGVNLKGILETVVGIINVSKGGIIITEAPDPADTCGIIITE